MSETKIHDLSHQLCDLLGANASNENVDKVSSVITELISEVAVSNTKAYNKIVRNHVSNNPVLAKQITDEIKAQRDTLIANLSALR